MKKGGLQGSKYSIQNSNLLKPSLVQMQMIQHMSEDPRFCHLCSFRTATVFLACLSQSSIVGLCCVRLVKEFCSILLTIPYSLALSSRLVCLYILLFWKSNLNLHAVLLHKKSSNWCYPQTLLLGFLRLYMKAIFKYLSGS